jgi:hypothetical protein
MRLAAVIAVVVLTSCGSTSSAALTVPSPSPAGRGWPSAVAVTPTAIQTASPVASPEPTPSPSAQPTAGSTPYVLTLTPPVAPPSVPQGDCALPVTWAYQPIQTGFLVYPTGPIVSPTQTLDRHALGATYDATVGRWLPVDPQAVSPDGLSFAYAEYDYAPGFNAGMEGGGAKPHSAGVLATTGRVHLMDARTGADRVLYSGAPTYGVVGFTADGIYLSQLGITMDGYFPSGLYLMPVRGGSPTPVAGGNEQLDRLGWTVKDGAAWGTEFTYGGAPTAGNQLVRLDLRSGAITKWLTEPADTSLEVLGFDPNSYPILVSQPSAYSSTGSPAPMPPTQVLALPAPNQPLVLFATTDSSALPPFAPVFADARGAWMGGQASVWFDAAGNHVTKTEVPAVNGVVFVGGTCQ